MSRKMEVLFVVARRGRYWVGHRAGPLNEDLAFAIADDFNRRKNQRRFAALQHVQPVRSRRLRELARRARRLAESIQEDAA